jgi:hypothetical protein
MAASSKSRLELAAKHAAHLRAQRSQRKQEPQTSDDKSDDGSDDDSIEGGHISAADWYVWKPDFRRPMNLTVSHFRFSMPEKIWEGRVAVKEEQDSEEPEWQALNCVLHVKHGLQCFEPQAVSRTAKIHLPWLILALSA